MLRRIQRSSGIFGVFASQFFPPPNRSSGKQKCHSKHTVEWSGTCTSLRSRICTIVMKEANNTAGEDRELAYGVKLDALGPIIVNSNGTTSRIANWNELTDHEKKVSLKRIAKRNKERREQIERVQQAAEEEQEGREVLPITYSAEADPCIEA
ncbi:hypothetical protein EON65_29590 [archaeon]|nr:MAG: hypothetical protein EON65_29590 [archaeon]